ncbi:MAG: hypothetical protein V2A54_03115, partial [Bacteroidota bacterium]
MKRKTFAVLLFLAVCVCSFSAIAQDKKSNQSGSWSEDRFYTGGTVGLMFGNKTNIEVSPMLGYDIFPKFSMGLGFTYLYYRFKDPYSQYKYSTNIWGLRGFARFLIIEQAFVYGEYETLGLDKNLLYNSNEKGTLWIDNIYVGGGYRQA